jgi:hypothetical protein
MKEDILTELQHQDLSFLDVVAVPVQRWPEHSWANM